MRTVSVRTDNFALKEKLSIDLTTLGYRVISPTSGAPSILLVDQHEFSKMEDNELKGVVLVVLSSVADGMVSLLVRAVEVLIDPYNITELELRLKLAQMKRGILDSESTENTLVVGGLVVNFDGYEVTIDGNLLDLTFKEYELLKHLISHKGRVYTRDQLLNAVWGYDYYGGTRTVDVHIRRLRAKLGRYESLIETVRNVGYRYGSPRPYRRGAFYNSSCA
ncbi:MAG: response regulator transcription factor, partial [Actinobacteria bacterium]|nr:response regulator transcription factor [Actinomycetota bacterium]